MPFWKCFPCMRFQNDEVITKLDYSNCALTDVPPDVSQHERTLEELYLSSNRIRALSPQLFYCQGIRVLFVNDNELESLPNAIGSLRQLQHLNLGRNGLSTVPDNIKSCKNLTRLDLSLNNLQRLPDAITSLISLQELLLNETNLEFLPANFGRLVNLKILELRSNNLITLPKSMSRLSNLNRIDIGANEFTELPEVICQLSQLRELWIDVNRIRRISPNVSNLRELRHFEANNNLLSTLPNEISNWRNLEVLSVSTNDMESLPFSIGMLKSLVTLQCEANQLRELPDSICHLENLEEMVISHNFILRLPSTIGMLRRLRFFCADENILRSLPTEMCSCTNLAVLSVRSNKIVELPQNMGQLVNLHVLNLVDNYITYLPLSVLSLTKLTALWISDNQSQPLVPLQYLNASNLTCFMLPQQAVLQQNGTQPIEYSDNGSTNSLQQREHDKSGDSYVFTGRAVSNPSQRIFFADEKADATFVAHEGPMTPQAQRICFANEEKPGNATFVAQNDSVTSPSRRICFADEVKGAETLATRLMRSPTPYPKELRLMAKYVRNNHHDQIQQQNAPYEDPMITAQTVRPASISTSPDQVDDNKYISSATSVPMVDSVKEARVLLNPGGNSVLLQQMHNSMSYHLIDRSRSVDTDVGESAQNSNNSTSHQNAQYLKQPTQIYPAGANMLNGQSNNIYSAQMQIPQQSPSIDMGGERLTPTSYVSQAAFSSQQQQQQQYYHHYRNSLHQSTSSVQQNYADHGYAPSPSLYDQQLRDTLYESSGSAHQVSASPSIISSYSQQGSQQQPHSMHSMQINKPPPYHIARAFTKKSREDLLNYDSIRNQINHCNGMDDGEEFNGIALCDQESIEIDQDDTKSEDINRRDYCTLNGHDVQRSLSPRMDNSIRRCGPNDNDYDSIDHQNNNDSSLNRTYSLHCNDGLIHRHSMLSLQVAENGSLDGSDSNNRRPLSRLSQRQEWNGTVNCDETIEGIDDGTQEMQLNSNSKFRAPPRSSSTTTWLFGLHKNPTVKQVAIKRDHEIGFEIQEIPNQGIFVRGTHPNTSAATLLHANDKLLEVDGYDFTKICLVDAQQILDNSGPVINVMISRT